MSELELNVDIPNEAGWPIQSVDSLCSLISRGTAPVYVEHSEVLAIGQRCVASTGFAPGFARPHSHRAMRNVLRPESGDVLLNSTGTGTIGRSVVFNSPGTFIVDGHVTVMRPRVELADSRWLNSVLHTPAFQRHLERFCFAGSTNQLELSRTPLRVSRLPTPHIDDQRAMGLVMDTLDTAIHETEAIIAKLKVVKQGLLHDLLTRGIDANGELRPPQAEAPHLYKLSPLGWIPKEWACKLFGDLCESSAFGPRFPSDAYDENGPLATLRTTDMDQEGNITLSTMPRAAISPSVFADHLLRPGDIVISRSGTCGVTGVFTGHDIPVVPGAFLIRFRLPDLRLNRFYRRYFNSSLGRPYLERLAVGGVQKNIKGSDVLCLQVPNPEPTEAVAIGDRIESVEYDIESNQQLLMKLKLQKTGLMDDLLTGRVRVTPLLEGVTP